MTQDLMLDRATLLRREFDDSFSKPLAGIAEETESLLALRAGGGNYAVRLAEIAGLFVDRRTIRLPSPVAEFLGVASLRHELVPVYSLRSMLRHTPGGELPRWLMLARGAHPVAFAFEEFDGYLQVPVSGVMASRDAASAHVPHTVVGADGMRGVVSIASLLKTLEDSVRRMGTTKEH
jgi:chemotaxis signal transduction protein